MACVDGVRRRRDRRSVNGIFQTIIQEVLLDQKRSRGEVWIKIIWQPSSACGAPLWMKMGVAARADLSELSTGDRVQADITAVACDPDWQSGPRCIEVSFFVALGN